MIELWKMEQTIQLAAFYSGLAVLIAGALFTAITWDPIWLLWILAGIGFMVMDEDIADLITYSLYFWMLQRKARK